MLNNKQLKMKTIKSIAFAVALTTATSSFAQTEHSHEAPHGGIVQEANGHHIEMVKTKDTLSFYVLDANGKAIKQKATGTVEYELTNKTTTKSTLTKASDGGLKVALPKANIALYCTVTLKVSGKTIASKFKNSVSKAVQEHGHEH